MAVITISREFGSAGRETAENVARVLGYHFADKEMLGKVLSQYGFVQFDEEYDSIPSFWARFESQSASQRALMVSMLNRVILALAHHDHIVILGRGSFAVLAGMANVLNVRIQAPFGVRAQRVMERQKNLTPAQAEMLVREEDRVRASFIETCYGVRWDVSHAFDLVIDTGKVSPELAQNWLIQAVEALEERVESSERTTDNIEVDPVLDSVVLQALGHQTISRV